MDPQGRDRLVRVISALEKMKDGHHLGNHAGNLVRDNVTLLSNAWSSLNSQAQQAILEKVEKALWEIEVAVDPLTGLNARQKLKRLIPTAYDLVKLAQSHFLNGQAWTTPIARDAFDEALKDIRTASGGAWRRSPEGSDIHCVWDWIDPSAQSEMLAYTQLCFDAIKQQREAKEQRNWKRSDVFSYPRLERYEELSGLSHDQMRELIAQHHLGTTESNQRSNDMPPPPRPSHAGPARSTSNAPGRFQAQARDPYHNSPANPPQPSEPGWPSSFHSGLVKPYDHIGAARAAQHFSRRGTQQNPFNID